MSIDPRPDGAAPVEPPPSSTEVIRKALVAAAGGRTVDVSALPLETPGDRALAELVLELLRFAVTVDSAVQMFLLALEVGPALNTMQMRGFGRMVQNRVPDCLAGKEGAFDQLAASLERDRRFLIDLNEAYREAIPAGSSSRRSAGAGRSSRRCRGPTSSRSSSTRSSSASSPRASA